MNNHWLKYQVKLRLLAHSRSFLANQKARNAIVGAENLLIKNILRNIIKGMGIFTPGEQLNTEHLKLKYYPSTPELEPPTLLSPYL